VGNGLTSTTLVFYLARQLGAEGLAVGLIVAAPQIAGLLRMAAPVVIDRLVDRKRFCMGCYVASGLVLIALPIASMPGALPSLAASLSALVALWCVYHLFEYLATVALWSWLADLTPARIRGRYIGRRERWLTLARIVGMGAAGLFADRWKADHPSQPDRWWIGYAVPAVAGAVMLIVAVVPLVLVPDADARRDEEDSPDDGKPVPPPRKSARGASWRAILAPFADRRYLGLLAFGCWFSLFNGVTQSAQLIYPQQVLGFGLLAMQMFQTGMRLGQSAVSPTLGRLTDRIGNRPVMIVCQALVATGLLFFDAASPQRPWWLAGAWIAWIAYAGINVGLPNLMLKLAPRGRAAEYAAAYFAVTGVFFGASTILGGVLFDALKKLPTPLIPIPLLDDRFDVMFVLGSVARALGIVLLLAIREPPTSPKNP
jgi:MFS family permease